MDDKQFKEILEDIELAEGRVRAVKIQLKMLETHLEAMRTKITHLAEENPHDAQKRRPPRN